MIGTVLIGTVVKGEGKVSAAPHRRFSRCLGCRIEHERMNWPIGLSEQCSVYYLFELPSYHRRALIVGKYLFPTVLGQLA